MDAILLSIHPNDPLWIAIAFLCGFAIRVVGLPPLVGFLAAGFMLNALGAEGGEFLNAMADLGITLLLFSIGLKLKLKSLARPEVWGVATLHMAVVTFLIAAIVLLFSYTSLPLLSVTWTQQGPEKLIRMLCCDGSAVASPALPAVTAESASPEGSLTSAMRSS